MDKPVVFGDSITGGRYGIWFGRFLSNEAAFHGIDGQFMDDIVIRAIKFCRNHRNQTVVIEGGVNDIVLAGCRKSVFREWKEDILTLRSMCDRLFICTLTPAGEDPDSKVNVIRAAINDAIRQNAEALDYTVIDVAKALDPLLSGTGLELNPLDLMFGDRDRLAGLEDRELEAESMDISSSRRLSVTTDGVHLNWRGAEIFARVMEGVLS